MAQTPGALGRRYLPFLALAAVQVLLVAIAPSKVPTTNSAQSTGNDTNLNATGAVDQNGNAITDTGTGGTTDTIIDANGNVVPRPGGSTQNTVALNQSTDRSHCDKAGKEIGPPGYKSMPDCQPVWHGGDNGGATMTGVTGTSINYIAIKAQGNAQVNALLALQGLAASDEESCEAKDAFHKEINKYWELYGRKFVALDGVGANKGSTQQSPCSYPYWQSQCMLTPPDPPCQLAEAKVVASLHPAFVLGGGTDDFNAELARQHIIVLGGGSAPGSYYTERAPYYYGLLMDGFRQASFDAEYWCKRLNAKPAIHAGTDVKSTRGWGATPGATPLRKLAVLFPETNGDAAARLSVQRFKNFVTGPRCNTPGGVLMIPYASDINTAQQQSVNIVQQLIDNKITTVGCFCDPIAPVFLTQNMSKQNYFPEHWIVGVGLMDYDVLGRLYDPSEWAHAFGVSDLGQGQLFASTDAARWWTDAGRSGLPDTTENAVLPFYSLMASGFMVAGSHPTPLSIHAGLRAIEPFASWQLTHDPHNIKVGFRPPSEWTAAMDTREVYWSQTRVSEIDNKPGSYCPVDGGHRFDLNEWLTGDPPVFDSAKNGC